MNFLQQWRRPRKGRPKRVRRTGGGRRGNAGGSNEPSVASIRGAFAEKYDVGVSTHVRRRGHTDVPFE